MRLFKLAQRFVEAAGDSFLALFVAVNPPDLVTCSPGHPVLEATPRPSEVGSAADIQRVGWFAFGVSLSTSQ